MKVEINGEARDVADGISIQALVEHLELTGRRIAVEVNGELVPRARHAARPLAPGDKIEIVTLVGGG